MLKDIEKTLLEMVGAESTPEDNKAIIAELIRCLPEKSSQGEIKDTVENQLATVELSDTQMTYLKYGDRTAQKDGLRIIAALDGTSVESEVIPRNGETPETP